MQLRGNLFLFNCKIYFILLFIFFISPCLYAEHDNSFRIDQNFYGTINERFQLQTYVFEQINKNMSDYNYLETAIGLQCQTALTWLSFFANYQQSYSEGGDNKGSHEQDPSLNINNSYILSRFKFTNQIRYEYRITSEWHNYRIKNTLGISLYDIFLKPYTGWELYYEDRNKHFMLNRIKFGIIENVYNSVSLGTYYRIDFSKIQNKWEFSRQLFGFQVVLKY
jgi:hypothetical protein